jgi:hypothetical protein
MNCIRFACAMIDVLVRTQIGNQLVHCNRFDGKKRILISINNTLWRICGDNSPGLHQGDAIAESCFIHIWGRDQHRKSVVAQVGEHIPKFFSGWQ